MSEYQRNERFFPLVSFLHPDGRLFCRIDEAAVIPQVLDAGDGGDSGHDPAQHGGDVCTLLAQHIAGQGDREVVEEDGQHLEHGLHLAPHVGGDDLAVLCTGGHHAEAGDGELAGQNDAEHHRAAHAVPHHVDESHRRQQLVGQRVSELAEVGDHVPLAGQMAVEEVGEAGHGEDEAGDKVVPRVVARRDILAERDEDHEHRHQQDAGQSEFIGQIHTKLSSNLLFYNSTIQIVKVAVVHQHIIELAGVERLFAGHADVAVHLGGIGSGAAEVEAALVVHAVAEDADSLAHLCGLLLGHDAGLDLHHQLSALVLDFLLDLAVHPGGNGVLLGGVGKAAQTVELHFLHEVAQVLELLFRLTREARDEGRAEGDVRDLTAQLADDVQQLGAVGTAVHVLEDRVVAVLDGQVEIRQDLLVPLHGGDEVVGDALRVSVHDADPLEARDLVQLVQQLADAARLAPVLTVGGRVLGHDDELLDALTGQPAGLGHTVGHLAAAQRAADAGDRAVVAAVVAALGDL